MSRLLISAAIALGACSASTTGDTGSVQSVRVVGAAGATSMTTAPTDIASSTTFEAPVDRVWRALPAVFDSLGIPVTHLDQREHVIGNADIKARGRLGKVALRRYVDCGSTQGGPNADTYDVWLSVMTNARAAATGNTMVSTTVQAMARPVTFAAEYFRCRSTRELENAIFDILRRQLAQ